jgi:hypothetical protein
MVSDVLIFMAGMGVGAIAIVGMLLYELSLFFGPRRP